jgi:hypothetical protein
LNTSTAGTTPRTPRPDAARARRRPTRIATAERTRRTPAIWRGDAAPRTAAPPPIAQAGHEPGFRAWRLVSGAILAAVLAMFTVLFSSNAFYVHAVSVAGLDSMTAEEVYQLSGVADMHLFWVDAAAVREALLRSPTIAEAEVSVGWEQPLVRVAITERAPVLVWEQGGVPVWVDLHGRIMRSRSDTSTLLCVVADEGDGPPESAIAVEVVNGAVQLHALIPEQNTLRYHPVYGLGYNDPRGWEVWFGTGLEMREKVVVYTAIAADLTARGERPRVIDVTDPDTPFWCCRAGG